jgi:hypothetical protein
VSRWDEGSLQRRHEVTAVADLLFHLLLVSDDSCWLEGCESEAVRQIEGTRGQGVQQRCADDQRCTGQQQTGGASLRGVLLVLRASLFSVVNPICGPQHLCPHMIC